jgi:hypothetical protein
MGLSQGTIRRARRPLAITVYPRGQPMVLVFSFFTRTPRTSNFARPNQSCEFAISDPGSILVKGRASDTGGSGGLVEDFRCAPDFGDAKEYEGRVRHRIEPAVGGIDVDVGFA